MCRELILASASPRRRRLLKQIGIKFRVIPSDVSEDQVLHHDPLENVQAIALSKARNVASRVKGGIVIGADTQILADGDVLGKPDAPEDAVLMLSKLNGKRVWVPESQISGSR